MTREEIEKRVFLMKGAKKESLADKQKFIDFLLGFPDLDRIEFLQACSRYYYKA